MQRDHRHAYLVRPLTECLRDAAVRDAPIRTRIVRLRSACRPTHIARFVGLVVVDAIERVTGRARPHIAQERFEVVPPLGAHGDAAAAVVGVGDVLRIVAAALHRLPRPILTTALRLPVFSLLAAHLFFSKAAARARKSSPQIVSVDESLVSAIARALPLLAVAIPPHSDESFEPLSNGNHAAIVARI